MKVFTFIISAILISLQAITSYLWNEKKLIEQFSEVFSYHYVDGVPIWSKFMFSYGYMWYGVSIFLFLMLVIGTFFKVNAKPKLQYLCLLLSFIALGAMWYAMYPLHVIFGGGVNI